MKKKSSLGILFIFSLFFSAVIINVRGETYTCALEAGDQSILEVVELDSFYGSQYGANLGDKFKVLVTSVTEGVDSFSIGIDYWGIISSSETFETTPDSQSTVVLPKDPTTLAPGLGYVVLSPVSSYLTEHALVYPDATVNGNTLQIYDLSDDTTEQKYTSNGIISELKQYNSTTTWYLMRRQGSANISGPDLPILIGITTMTVLSLVYIRRKRKQV